MGKLESSRAVGNALRKNPKPMIIPCHRVVKSNGDIGGYSEGKNLKKELLEKEGVTVENGKIQLEKYLFSDFLKLIFYYYFISSRYSITHSRTFSPVCFLTSHLLPENLSFLT